MFFFTIDSSKSVAGLAVQVWQLCEQMIAGLYQKSMKMCTETLLMQSTSLSAMQMTFFTVVFCALLNNPGPRGRLLGDTDHSGLCTGGGTGGELQRHI